MPKLLGPVMQARGLTMSRLITDWARLAGEAQDWSEPHALKFPPKKKVDGCLTVNVASGRGPEMQMMSDAIISRINQLFGYRAVSRITITQAAMYVQKGRKEKKNSRHANTADKAVFDTIRKTIPAKASPELQEVLDRLGKSLADD